MLFIIHFCNALSIIYRLYLRIIFYLLPCINLMGSSVINSGTRVFNLYIKDVSEKSIAMHA